MFEPQTIEPLHEKKKKNSNRLSHHEYHTAAKFLAEFCQAGSADGLSMGEIARAVTDQTSIPFNDTQVAAMRDQLGLEWTTKYKYNEMKGDKLVAKIDYLENKMIDITTSFNILEKRLNLLNTEFNRM